jgi:hypothetical protein
MHRILLLHLVVFTDEFEERHARPLVAVPDRFTPVLFVLVFAEPGYGSAAPIYETMIMRSFIISTSTTFAVYNRCCPWWHPHVWEVKALNCSAGREGRCTLLGWIWALGVFERVQCVDSRNSGGFQQRRAAAVGR